MFPANDEYYSDFDTSETGRPTETHVRINNRYNFRRVVANNSRSTSSTTASRNGSRTSNHSSRYDAGRDHSSRYDAGRGTENGSGPISRSDSRGSSSQAAAVEPDAEDDVEKCVICFEALHAERVEELSCKHVFHHRCVQRYFNAIPATRNKTCVLCRHVIHQATQEEPDVEIIDPRPPHQPNRSLNGTTTNNEFQAISSASRQRVSNSTEAVGTTTTDNTTNNISAAGTSTSTTATITAARAATEASTTANNVAAAGTSNTANHVTRARTSATTATTIAGSTASVGGAPVLEHDGTTTNNEFHSTLSAARQRGRSRIDPSSSRGRERGPSRGATFAHHEVTAQLAPVLELDGTIADYEFQTFSTTARQQEREIQESRTVQSSPRRRRVGPGRGASFTYHETTTLLYLVEQKLPVSITDWEQIASTLHTICPNTSRTGDGCRRKFLGLCNRR